MSLLGSNIPSMKYADYIISNESEFKVWFKDAKENKGLVFKSGLTNRKGEPIDSEEEFYSAIRMSCFLDKDIGDWLNEPNKKEALAEIKALKNAINQTSQRIKMTLKAKDNGIDIDKLLPLLNQEQERISTRVGRLPRGLTKARIIATARLGEEMIRYTNKRPTATPDGLFDSLIRIYFRSFNPDYLGSDQRELLKRAIEVIKKWES